MFNPSADRNKPGYRTYMHMKILCISSLMALTCLLAAQSGSTNDAALLDSFVRAKGYNSTIVFSSDNIKQFWIDKSVVSLDNSIRIILNEDGNSSYPESVPMKIQLANVNAAQDCRIDIISNTKDLAFSVLDSKLNRIALSAKEDDFIQYSVSSASFHMDKTQNLSFYLKFRSGSTSDQLDICRIILSFSDNRDFMASPGKIVFSKDNIETKYTVSWNEDNSFSLTGRYSSVLSQKRILLSENTVVNGSVKIKNIGNVAARVYLAYAPYTKEGVRIDSRNNRYKGESNIVRIVEAKKNSNKVIVDSYPKWEKNCVLVLNVKEDFSDFPNSTFVGGVINNIEETDNGQSIITLEKPISEEIRNGTPVRIQAREGANCLYPAYKTIEPGEEVVFQTQTKMDSSFQEYSPKAFCKGTYYICPLIMSNSMDPQSNNTVLISDCTISFE